MVMIILKAGACLQSEAANVTGVVACQRMRQILLSVQFLLVCIKVEVVIRQAVREAQLGPEEVSVGILSLQIRVTRYASRDCIVVTGGKLLVVGEVGQDAGHVLGIKSCAYVDAPELLGLQQEKIFNPCSMASVPSISFWLTDECGCRLIFFLIQSFTCPSTPSISILPI